MKKYNSYPILLSAIILALTLSSISINAKQGNLEGPVLIGRVVDAATGEPLTGVNIMIKNTNIGTSTGEDGSFVIFQAPEREIVLQVSMISYKPIYKTINMKQNKPDDLVFELIPSTIEMGAVVVTGTNSTHLYEKAPVKTEIIPKTLISKQNAYNLAQALGLQTGVMVENDCNNCNFTQVRILGFDGKYSQLLIDGDPVISSLGGVYGLEHYPREMIEQIEIVKGGGSALYGGGAVAGTINMMTRKPYSDKTQISYNGNSFEGGYDQQIGVIAEMVSDDHNSGFYIYGSARDRDSYDRNGDGYTELGILKNETIGFNGFLKPFDNSELQLSLHRIYEERRGGSELEKPVHEARISEMVRHSKWGGKIKFIHKINALFDYKINYAFSLLERESYYGGLAEDTPEARLEALNYYGFSDNPLHTAGIQANYFLGPNYFSVGIQYDYDKLLDKSVANEAYYVDETFKNLGLFLQDEISLDDEQNSQVVAGIRFDDHSALESWIISPRINIKHKLFDALTLRAGMTTGFKAPQIFDEDLHICGLEGTQRVIRNSDGLKEEKSASYNFSAEFQDFIGEMPVLFGITGFYTTLSDAYTDKFISSDGTIEYWERINSSGAAVKGIEIDFGIKPISPLEIRTGFTFKKNQYDEDVEDFNTKEFFRTPEEFGFLRAGLELSPTFDAFFSVKYTGSMYVPHEVVVDYQEDPLLVLTKSESFLELDISFTKKVELFRDVFSSFSIGVKNLTDAYQNDLDYGVTRDPGYVYGTSQPRTFFFNVDLSL